MELSDKVRVATKWTFFTEFFAKIISPVTGMILARLLTPEAFGVMASVMVVTSFAEIFADAGFQKYFVQHEFYNEEEKRRCFGTALTTSCIVAGLIWLLIICFARDIAILLGTAEVEDGIKVAGFALILTSYNGMQSAVFKRSFQFKLLFKLRMITLVVPLLVTIPLAYVGLGFWALIWGMIVQQGITCLVQSYYTDMPVLGSIDVHRLREMLSFTLWTLFESITIWFSTYGGMFLVGMLLSSYYLGLYRGILTLTGAAFGLLTGAIVPVIFVALSRLQNDMPEFRRMFYVTQSKAALVLMPLGIMLLVFSDVAVEVMLGAQWHEGDFFFGIWSLTSTFSILINSLASESLRAKGMPRLSAVSQILHFPVMWIALWYGAKFGFDAVALGMCVSSLWLDMVKLFMLRQVLGFSIRIITINIFNATLPAVVAGILAWQLRVVEAIYGTVALMGAIAAYCLCYLLLLAVRKDNRRLLIAGAVYLRDRIRR